MLQHNLSYRHAILTEAEHDRDIQHSLIQMSAASLGFFIRTFAWTFRQMEVGDGGRIIQVRGTSARRPFIPWPRQDHVFAELQSGIEDGHDLMIDKSRNQGATWMCLLTFLWYWLFDRNCTFLVVSRKEEEVDKRGNRKSLFWKIDYALQNLPAWMVPTFIRTHMHLEAVERENVIDGESTNADVGRGHGMNGRRALVPRTWMMRPPSPTSICLNAQSLDGSSVGSADPDDAPAQPLLPPRDTDGS